MATDLKFKTRALVSVAPEGVTLNSNLTQAEAVMQQASLNSAFKAVTGNDLNKLYIQTAVDGTVIVFNGEGIHLDVQDGISLHSVDDFAPSISKMNTFINSLKGITGYPVSKVNMDTEVV